MPRIRTVKPEMWEDERFATLKRDCRLMFIGMFNFADDNGVIKDNPTYIKSRIFPYDEDLRIIEIKAWSDALVKARMLIPFSHGGEGYYVIRTFNSHQIIDKRYARYIVPVEVTQSLLNVPFEDNTEATRLTHSEPIEVTMSEGKGRDRIGNGSGKDSKGKEGFSPPSLEEVQAYFKEKGYEDSIACKAFQYYDSAGWKDSKGNQVKNWKQKMISVWFKPENKIKPAKASREMEGNEW